MRTNTTHTRTYLVRTIVIVGILLYIYNKLARSHTRDRASRELTMLNIISSLPLQQPPPQHLCETGKRPMALSEIQCQNFLDKSIYIYATHKRAMCIYKNTSII